ncbi:MAG: 2,3-diphosphoglycerate-dependent phosphoglycerate mutase [Bdellovibrionales bacterium]|nr:2,3-diphosphoglycerate-dependent phosphoglycerate mutase [Bdellovibrionales bacterium]
MSFYNLILVRHGQSQWNLENRFTGWTDIDLSGRGKEEAQRAGALLKKNNFNFDVACTSVLKRAIRTLWVILDEMDQMWVPVIKSWRLNERHYGSLTGLSKKETIEKYGEKQVQLWRRDYKTSPPLLPVTYQEGKDRCYQNIEKIPVGESLQQTKERVLPFWKDTVTPYLKEGKTVLITAHGNSLRALVKHIENLSDVGITKVEVPTGTPIAYALSKSTLKPERERKIL